MTLKEHIDDIRKRLEQNEFTSEAAVRQGIIDRLLGALKWPTYDTNIVFPEYRVDDGKVDYALCNPDSKPRVFIEAKGVGNIDKGTKQLFNYAYTKGVTILILTDGQKWRFYHPAGEGSFEDRKVVELDFIVGDSELISTFLIRYLSYKSVQSGDAAKDIAEDYRNIVNQRKIEERLPEVWTELVQDKNRDLLRAMMKKTKDKVGHEPTEEQVVSFLKNLSVPSIKSPSVPKIVHEKPKQDKKKIVFTKLIVTMPDGEIIDHQHGKDTYIDVLEKLGLEEVMRVHPQTVATEPFYSHREQWENLNVQRGEFYINLNNGTPGKKRILEEIANSLGVQLKVELIEKY